jgi:hypothetical protein
VRAGGPGQRRPAQDEGDTVPLCGVGLHDPDDRTRGARVSARTARRETASAARTAGAATSTALALGGGSTGAAAQRAGEVLQRAGSALESRSAAAAPTWGAAVEQAVGDASTAVVDVLSGPVAGTLGAAADVARGLLEEPRVRGGAAVDALRGATVRPPAAARRWPWALGAALLGAAAGAAVAYLVRRVEGQDAPGAQEPHELRAVVDLPGTGTAPVPPAPAAGPAGTEPV